MLQNDYLGKMKKGGITDPEAETARTRAAEVLRLPDGRNPSSV